VLSVLRQPEVAWFFASVFFTVLAHTSLYAFFSLYLDSWATARRRSACCGRCRWWSRSLFFWWQGRFFDRLAPHRWLPAGGRGVGAALRGHRGAGRPPVVLVLAQAAACDHLRRPACGLHRADQPHFAGPLRGRGQALYTVLGYGLSGVLGGVGGGWLGSSRQGRAGLRPSSGGRGAGRHAACGGQRQRG
jgi:PPP family 3-phenylpropionic acid transporter